jgi:hypothetical protein
VLSGALVAGVASSGTILNATAGSAIASTVSGLTVSSAARTYTYNGSGAAGSTNNGLTETLAGATFSPRGNVVTIVSSAVPAFTSNPSISPQGGNVGGTFSGIDGAMGNGGSILSRRWLLNGTAIGSGTTVVPNAVGSLTFENTGTGNVVATSSAVTVADGTPAPAPSFTAQPSISPSSGSVGQSFTGSDGTVSNGTVASRRWLLNGAQVSTAEIYVSTAAGSLVYEVTATGAGGTTIATSTSVNVAAVGGVPALPATASFDGVDPYVDLNDGGSYRVAGTTYPTIAAMVTAGIYTQVTPGATTMQNGDQLVFPAALPSPYTVRAEGTTGPAVAANGVAQTMVSLEDAGSVITDEIFQLRRQYTSTGSTNRASILAYKGSASQANYQDLNGTLNGLSQPVVIVGSAAPNSYQLAYGARDASRQTMTATVSTGLTRMIIGNQSDGARSWTGAVKRVTIWLSVFVPTQMTALSAYPFSGSVYGAHTGNEQPFSQQYGNKVYVGQSRSGFQSLAEIDVDTKVMTDLINVGSAYSGNDDHRSPVMLKTPTGKFFTVYTGHGDDNIIRYRRSTDGSPRNLGSEQQISTSGIGSAAYSMVHNHPATGAMYIIVRSSLLKWVFSVSTDDGVTFSAPKVLTTHPSKQSYIYGEWATANRLRFFANENAALEATLRIFEWDIVTGNIYAANNTIVGNSETGGVNFDDMTIFRPYTADRSSQIMCFGNDATSIMYGQLNDRDELSRQMVAKLNTGADPFVPANWVTTAITPEYTGASDQRRFNGQGTFSYRTDLAMPRAFVCVRIGTNWVLQQIDFTAADLSTFTTTNLRSVPDTDYNAILRPRSPKGSDGRLDVSWQEGLYPNYQTWDPTKINRRWAA